MPTHGHARKPKISYTETEIDYAEQTIFSALHLLHLPNVITFAAEMNKEDWTYRKLGEVAESELGKTLDSKKNTGDFYPYLCAINVLWDKFDIDKLKEMRFEVREIERYSIREGDLVVCEGGDIGRCAIWDKKETVLYQNALHRVRFNDEMLPRFCMFFLMSLKKTGELDSKYGKGVTIKHLVKSSLLSIPVPVPPLPTQQRIVAELDCISGILEKKRQQLKELDNLAQAIFYDMFGDPVENEMGWEVKKWKDLFETRLGKMLDAKHQVSSDVSHYYLGNSNVQWGYFDLKSLKTMTFSKDEEKKFELKYGDLLICEGGESGRCAVWTEAQSDIKYQKAIHRARCKQELILPVYARFYLQYFKSEGGLKDYISKSTIEHLTGEKLDKVPVVLPPLSLQQQFAKKIEAIERQKALISQSIKKVQTLFDCRMEEYFG